MKYALVSGAIITLALLVPACAAPVTGASSPSTLPAATATQPAITELPAATRTPAVEAYPGVDPTRTATATSTANVPVTGGTTVKASLSDRHGLILVNGDGFALYLYKEDVQNAEASACTDEDCTTDWIPLTTEGSPVAGEGAIQQLLGTITREDGRAQVTYNGWPLYLHAGDEKVGSTKGQGMEGKWFLVSPSGTAISK